MTTRGKSYLTGFQIDHIPKIVINQHCFISTQKHPEPQVRGGIDELIGRYFFLFLNKNICCDPSLEPSQDGSNDESQNMFLIENCG